MKDNSPVIFARSLVESMDRISSKAGGTGLAPNSYAHGDNSIDDVILVDSNDISIGTFDKLQAHRLGLRHRAVSIIVRDGKGRLLLQQRADGKYHSGGLWTNTCCTHPRPGERAVDAAVRRLAEEMGITCGLTFLFTTHYRAAVSNTLIEDEVVHLFAGEFDGAPNPDLSEVQAWEWKTESEIMRDLDQRPEAYTVWFQLYCRQFWDRISK